MLSTISTFIRAIRPAYLPFSLLVLDAGCQLERAIFSADDLVWRGLGVAAAGACVWGAYDVAQLLIALRRKSA